VGDVRLTGDDHGDHRLVADRAADPAGGVIAAALRHVAGVDRFGAGDRLQVLVFEHVEPDAVAAAAAVDLDTLEPDLPHVGAALRALHRGSPLFAGKACRADPEKAKATREGGLPRWWAVQGLNL